MDTKEGVMNHAHNPLSFMAEGPGFEPGLTGPEPVVLPLDDPSIDKRFYLQKSKI